MPSHGTCNGTTTVICSLGTLVAGAAVALTVRVDTTGPISNTVGASSDQTDPTPSNNDATATLFAVAPAIPTLSSWMLLALAAMFPVLARIKLRAQV